MSIRACLFWMTLWMAGPVAAQEILWHDVRSLGIEGQGWSDTAAPFDRFPARAEGKVPASVWSLSRHSAGMAVRFVTDAKRLEIKWKLTSDKLGMVHMPATGVSGVDLYVRTHSERWQWLNVGRPTAKENVQSFEALGKRLEYLVYLPLYNGVTSVEIGVPKGAMVEKAPPRAKERSKPIVFYGTSITQGGCASRPGMVHTAIIGRHLDYPVINLGFSGNGKMDASVVDLLAEIDAALYVIDCLPNMTADLVTSRTAPLVRALRKARPTTPILLVEDRTYANASVMPSLKQRNDSSRGAFKVEYDKLVKEGVKGLTYLRGDHLIGDDGEGTVDGSHPTDLGFLRQAEAFLAVIQPILK
jgi:hypothetical protein